MHTTEIQDRLQGMEASLADRGLITPRVWYGLRFVGSSHCVQISYRIFPNTDVIHVAVYEDDAVAAIESAERRIAEIKSLAEIEREHFLQQLARTLETAKRLGVSSADIDELVDPLTVMMKRLSENALVAQEAAR